MDLNELVYALLMDADGISEFAYNALDVYLYDVDLTLCHKVRKLVDATDGRFYFPDNVTLEDIS